MVHDPHDWLLVQLEELAEAVGAVVAKLEDVEDDDELAKLDEEVDGILDERFDHSRIALVDARTAASILRPPARIRAYADTLVAKMQVLERAGELEAARDLARRALELHLEAAVLEPEPARIDRAAIVALMDRDPPPRMAARYRELLVSLADGE